MRRAQLERILREAARVTGDSDFVVIGSQAFHACRRRCPAEVLISRECDLYPRNRPEAALLLANELSRDSQFAKTHGFYADVVTPEIASLPDGWQRRLKPLRIGRVTAWCLEPHDLVVSKLAAGRLKDLEFAGALLKLKIVNVRTLRSRLAKLPAQTDHERVQRKLEAVLDD